MRIYSNCRDLMSEMGRELNSYGLIVKPKHYQNKNIEGKDDFITKELISQQYCLTSLDKVDYLFAYTYTKEWADAEFQERISGEQLNPGEAWELNKPMWEEFLDTSGCFDYTYAERINDPVYYSGKYETPLNIVIKLLKEDPDTRKAILPIFYGNIDLQYLDGSCRIPCSMYYDFLIREYGSGVRLNICYHQRSADFTAHFGDDVYLAWRMMEYVAKKIGIKPGFLFHTIDSLHVYKRHWDMLASNIEDLVEDSTK